MDLDQLIEAFDLLCDTHLCEVGALVDVLSSRGEPVVLLCLLRNESMLPGELADACGLSTGRVANILRRLEAKGIVVRQPDELDRRKTHVRLTDPGVSLALRTRAEVTAARRDLMSYLGERDGADLVRVLGRCLEYGGGPSISSR